MKKIELTSYLEKVEKILKEDGSLLKYNIKSTKPLVAKLKRWSIINNTIYGSYQLDHIQIEQILMSCVGTSRVKNKVTQSELSNISVTIDGNMIITNTQLVQITNR